MYYLFKRSPFLHQNTSFYNQILQATWKVSIEDSKICEISKSTIHTLEPYFEILTLHPCNSKSSFPTTGTFRYVVESHFKEKMCILVVLIVHFRNELCFWYHKKDDSRINNIITSNSPHSFINRIYHTYLFLLDLKTDNLKTK